MCTPNAERIITSLPQRKRIMKLTLQKLVELRACEKQRIIFAEHFGTEVEVTEGLCEKFAGDFNWGWAAQNLLIALARGEYNRTRASAQAERKRTSAPALAEYNRAITHAWSEYLRAMVPARAEYECAMASARDEYNRAVDSANSEFNRVEAITFARLYNDQG